jgi:hypothetical protein
VKTGVGFGLVICLVAGTALARPEQAESPVRLVGIAQLSKRPIALLEWQPAKDPRQPLVRSRWTILGQSERQVDLEVLDINASAGKVKINKAGKATELAFTDDGSTATPIAPSAAVAGEPAFLRLQHASREQVFAVYQLLSRRTLIRPSSLREGYLDLYSREPVAVSDLTRAIEHALAETGILIRPDGDKLAFVGREADLGLVTPQLRDLAASLGKSLGKGAARVSGPAPGNGQQNEEILPEGTINFPQVDTVQVLAVYQELAGRTLIWAPHLGGGTISLRTGAPMSRTEAI